MRKYQFSQQYRLSTAEDIADTDTALTVQLKQGELYGLFDTTSGECVIINSTMYLFLKQYETPKTLDEVAAFFATEFDCTPKEVLPIVRPFLREMKERGVIVLPKAVKNMELISSYPVGTLMDQYRIEEKLATNLPLEVYKATDLKTEQFVILKVLRMPAALSKKRRQEWREMFSQEFFIQKILRGALHVCQLLDLKPDYAVLEWIEGNSLRHRLTEGDAIDAETRHLFLTQILESYAFMHKNNILHGDVHARNILVTKNNQIKIIDFDLAHQLTETGDFPPVRGGAPEFVPPENVQFDAFNIVKGEANFQTEVYQLGILAYWVIYGKPPFAGDTWEDLATAILTKAIDIPPLPKVSGSAISISGDLVVPEMVAFLEKSLAKNPNDRFVSAETMCKAFTKIGQEVS
jgi:eukaryotic-like serine/threonine-protein kinase